MSVNMGWALRSRAVDVLNTAVSIADSRLPRFLLCFFDWPAGFRSSWLNDSESRSESQRRNASGTQGNLRIFCGFYVDKGESVACSGGGSAACSPIRQGVIAVTEAARQPA
jgi:hypothetical protein